MTTNNHPTRNSEEITNEMWRSIVERMNGRAPETYAREVPAEFTGHTVLSNPFRYGRRSIEAAVSPRTNINVEVHGDSTISPTTGYNFNWAVFDEADLVASEFIGRPNNEVTRQRILERVNGEIEATVNHTRLTDAEMRFRGTGVNLRALPQDVIDIVVMPQREMARKERLYLKVIQDLNDQLQSIKTVTKCAVERVEL
jgi:hypothetical protein